MFSWKMFLLTFIVQVEVFSTRKPGAKNELKFSIVCTLTGLNTYLVPRCRSLAKRNALWIMGLIKRGSRGVVECNANENSRLAP